MIEKKIAFLGLENSGITSFIVILHRKFDIEKELRNVKPSKSIQRTEFQFINHKFLNLDFSGNISERTQYLANKEQNFAQIDLFFFIVDIQNPQTFDEALEYFGSVLSYLKEINRKVPVIVSFHKLDPNITADPTIIENLNQMQEKLQPWLDFTKFQFCTSTIFETQTMIRAYSAGLRSMYDQSEVVQNYMLDLTQTVENIISFLLFDSHGFLVGEYFLEQMTTDQKKILSKLFTFMEKRIYDNEKDDYEFSERIDAWTEISNLVQTFEIGGIVFYTLLVLQGHEDKEKLDEISIQFRQFIPGLKNILAGLMKIED